MEKYIVGAVIIIVVALPSVLRIIYRAHRRAESAQEVLSKPFVCPNCGHRFYFDGKRARIIGEDKDGKVSLLLDYTDRPGASIADPWYSGNFDVTYDDILEGCEGFLEYLKDKGEL
jgi:hypothetical protein